MWTRRSASPTPAPFPIFGRISLTNPETGLDDLDLERELAAALRAAAQPRSTQPATVRFVPESPIAVQLRGTYTLKGDAVEVKLNLISPGLPPVPMPVSAPRAEIVAKLVEAIMKWAQP